MIIPKNLAARKNEELAQRMILAWLCDDANERDYYLWIAFEESGLTRQQFSLALRTSRDAATVWKEFDMVDAARGIIMDRLERLVAPA